MEENSGEKHCDAHILLTVQSRRLGTPAWGAPEKYLVIFWRLLIKPFCVHAGETVVNTHDICGYANRGKDLNRRE